MRYTRKHTLHPVVTGEIGAYISEVMVLFVVLAIFNLEHLNNILLYGTVMTRLYEVLIHAILIFFTK